MKEIEELVHTYQIGSMTAQDFRSFLGRQAGVHPRDRKKTLDMFKTLAYGVRFMKRVRAERNGSFSKRIPQEVSWRKLVLMTPKEQAQWHMKNCPEVGTPEYNMFKRLCRAFGVGGNEFYYWLRKLR